MKKATVSMYYILKSERLSTKIIEQCCRENSQILIMTLEYFPSNLCLQEYKLSLYSAFKTKQSSAEKIQFT